MQAALRSAPPVSHALSGVLRAKGFEVGDFEVEEHEASAWSDLLEGISGVLRVRAEGRDGLLAFMCRIEHTYDVAELLAAKEERLEERLWSTVLAFEELATLLSDLAATGSRHGESAGARRAYETRVPAVREHARTLRAMMNASRPVDLTPSESDGVVPHDQS